MILKFEEFINESLLGSIQKRVMSGEERKEDNIDLSDINDANHKGMYGYIKRTYSSVIKDTYMDDGYNIYLSFNFDVSVVIISNYYSNDNECVVVPSDMKRLFRGKYNCKEDPDDKRMIQIEKRNPNDFIKNSEIIEIIDTIIAECN